MKLNEKFDIPSIKENNEKYNELKKQFLEMAQLKSDFDIEKFTVKKEGNFIAHNFHFLMRQYSLSMNETNRLLIDREEKLRRIKDIERYVYEEGNDYEIPYNDSYADLEIKRLKNAIDLIELDLVNKLAMCKGFESCRVKLIELNGGESPSNEQYQAEEPEYWKWFLQKKAVHQFKERATGIKEGVWENIQFLEEPALLSPEYQVKLLNDHDGMINVLEAEKEINRRMDFDSRVKNIEFQQTKNQ